MLSYGSVLWKKCPAMPISLLIHHITSTFTMIVNLMDMSMVQCTTPMPHPRSIPTAIPTFSCQFFLDRQPRP